MLNFGPNAGFERLCSGLIRIELPTLTGTPGNKPVNVLAVFVLFACADAKVGVACVTKDTFLVIMKQVPAATMSCVLPAVVSMP
jgi:hypothetical protein